MTNRWKLLVCGWAVGFLACPAHPWGVIPNYDFDWVTIGDLGNAPYEGGPLGQLAGRGSVECLYRISRFEEEPARYVENCRSPPSRKSRFIFIQLDI